MYSVCWSALPQNLMRVSDKRRNYQDVKNLLSFTFNPGGRLPDYIFPAPRLCDKIFASNPEILSLNFALTYAQNMYYTIAQKTENSL